jgi:hypothetical protein
VRETQRHRRGIIHAGGLSKAPVVSPGRAA